MFDVLSIHTEYTKLFTSASSQSRCAALRTCGQRFVLETDWRLKQKHSSIRVNRPVHSEPYLSLDVLSAWTFLNIV